MQLVTLFCQQPSQDTFGYLQALPLAKVFVYFTGTQGIAQLYDDSGSPIQNPAAADINGFLKFEAADGVYDIQVLSADGTYTSPLIEAVQLFDQGNYNQQSLDVGSFSGSVPLSRGYNGIANTSGANLPLTLPAAPHDGDTVEVMDEAGFHSGVSASSAATNPWTITAPSTGQTFTMNIPGGLIRLRYSAKRGMWIPKP